MTIFIKDHAKVKNVISELNYNTNKYFQGIRYLEAKECRLAAFDFQRVFTIKSEAPTFQVLKDRCYQINWSNLSEQTARSIRDQMTSILEIYESPELYSDPNSYLTPEELLNEEVKQKKSKELFDLMRLTICQKVQQLSSQVLSKTHEQIQTSLVQQKDQAEKTQKNHAAMTALKVEPCVHLRACVSSRMQSEIDQVALWIREGNESLIKARNPEIPVDEDLRLLKALYSPEISHWELFRKNPVWAFYKLEGNFEIATFSPEIFSNLEVMKKAVSKNPDDLQWSSPEFCKNSENMRKLIAINGRCARYIDDQLRLNDAFMFDACRQGDKSIFALEFASPKLRQNKERMLQLFENISFGNPYSNLKYGLRYVDDKVLSQFDYLIEICKKDAHALDYIDKKYSHDPEILKICLLAPHFHNAQRFIDNQDLIKEILSNKEIFWDICVGLLTNQLYHSQIAIEDIGMICWNCKLDFMKDAAFILSLIPFNPEIVQIADQDLLNNIDFRQQAVDVDLRVLDYLYPIQN